jgi:predicted nucleic-acid-binding protein
MPSIDTNCLLRWILNDIPEQTVLVAELFRSHKNIILADVAIIETVFVLEKVKKISRATIEKAVLAVIENDVISCNEKLFREILPVYTSHSKLSFVDCYLEVLARSTNTIPLFTFDKKLATQLAGAQLLT